MVHLGFTFANLPFVVDVEDERLPVALPPTYAPFLVSEAPPDPVARYRSCILCDTVAEPRPQDILWRCETWRMIRADKGYAIQLSNQAVGDWATAAVLSNDFSDGNITPWQARRDSLAEYCLNYPYDRVILVNRLAFIDGMVLHASGVEFEGRAFLFCGRSQVGKTTTARVWVDRGARLMNDDRMAVRWQDGACMATATPWHGEDPTVTPKSAPVAGIFHLSQAPEHATERLSAGQAAAALLATALAPFYCAESMEQILRTADHVADSVPSFRLAAAKDPSVVDFVLETVRTT